MKFKILLILFAAAHFCGIAQTDYRPYRLPEKMLEIEQIHTQTFVHDKIKQDLSTSETGYEANKEKFASAQAKATAYLHSSGYVYGEFYGIEKYLNTVLKKIVPKEIMDKMGFKVYLYHDPSINAFTTAAANIYVHPGLIAECSSEDELALVLSHEVAHRLGDDVYEGFYRKEQVQDRAFVAGLFGLGILSYLDFALAVKFDRNQEATADIVGAKMLCEAGYSVTHGAKIFEKFTLLETQYKLMGYRGGLGSILYGSTHPAPENRLESILNQCSDIANPSINNEFLEAQKICRYEVLKMHLEQYDFRAAIIQGWRYIGESDDIRLKFMTFDALRRLKQLTPSIMSEPILSSAFEFPKDLNEKLVIASSDYTSQERDLLSAALFGSEIQEFTSPLNSFELSFQTLYDHLLKYMQERKECDNCQFLVMLDSKANNGTTTSLQKINSLKQDYQSDDYNEFLTDITAGMSWIQNANTLFIVRNIDLTKRVSGMFVTTFEDVPVEDAIGLLNLKSIATSSGLNHDRSIKFYDQVVAQQTPRKEYELSNYLRLLDFAQTNNSSVDLFIVDPSFYNFCRSEGINSIETLDFRGNCTQTAGSYFTLSPMETLLYKNFRAQMSLFEFEKSLKTSVSSARLMSMVKQKTMIKMLNKLQKKLSS